jgi:hypothetical protein
MLLKLYGSPELIMVLTDFHSNLVGNSIQQSKVSDCKLNNEET